MDLTPPGSLPIRASLGTTRSPVGVRGTIRSTSESRLKNILRITVDVLSAQQLRARLRLSTSGNSGGVDGRLLAVYLGGTATPDDSADQVAPTLLAAIATAIQAKDVGAVRALGGDMRQVSTEAEAEATLFADTTHTPGVLAASRSPSSSTPLHQKVVGNCNTMIVMDSLTAPSPATSHTISIDPRAERARPEAIEDKQTRDLHTESKRIQELSISCEQKDTQLFEDSRAREINQASAALRTDETRSGLFAAVSHDNDNEHETDPEYSHRDAQRRIALLQRNLDTARVDNQALTDQVRVLNDQLAASGRRVKVLEEQLAMRKESNHDVVEELRILRSENRDLHAEQLSYKTVAQLKKWIDDQGQAAQAQLAMLPSNSKKEAFLNLAQELANTKKTYSE